MWTLFVTVTVAAPNSAYLNQAFYTIRAGGRAGEIPVGEISRPQTVNDVVMVIT